MISADMFELLFRPAGMQRWNGYIRPHTGFTELDKQAQKLVFAYVLGKTEESDRGHKIDWQKLIEGGIFELLHRCVLTDLKPDLLQRLMDQKSRELNTWVIEQIQPSIQTIGQGFNEKLNQYLFESDYAAYEKRILKAAHFLATNWEFQIIHQMNTGLYGLEQTNQEIANEVEEFYDLAGVQKYLLGKKTRNFMDLVGQLRFQQRWGQSPRVPQTSVLGHMLIVAILCYLFSVEIKAGERRVYNNFFAGLFHDLPEVLTRDIVSPVKRSVEGLEAIIKEIEKEQFATHILTLLPRQWMGEILYFLEDEFQSKVVINGRTVICSSDTINQSYNSDQFNALDGELVRAADQLAAYIEASLSISYGMKAPVLIKAKGQIYNKCAGLQVGGIDFRRYFDKNMMNDFQ